MLLCQEIDNNVKTCLFFFLILFSRITGYSTYLLPNKKKCSDIYGIQKILTDKYIGTID